MLITLPDPHPGRCLNFRSGKRCLDYDGHDSKCQFPPEEKKPYESNWDQIGWSLKPVEPEPWVAPWDENRGGDTGITNIRISTTDGSGNV